MARAHSAPCLPCHLRDCGTTFGTSILRDIEESHREVCVVEHSSSSTIEVEYQGEPIHDVPLLHRFMESTPVDTVVRVVEDGDLSMDSSTEDSPMEEQAYDDGWEL